VIVRKIFVNSADADFVRKAWKVPNCRTLLCTIREVWKNGKRQPCEKRYFVSSLDARRVSPERFLELVRGHWQIENRLHLIKDRWWDDDRQVLFRPGLGEIWSALTDLALSLLRTVGEKGKAMPRKAMKVDQKPLDYLKLLGY
jgi:predicted transposase YbfD/YdcC